MKEPSFSFLTAFFVVMSMFAATSFFASENQAAINTNLETVGWIALALLNEIRRALRDTKP